MKLDKKLYATNNEKIKDYVDKINKILGLPKTVDPHDAEGFSTYTYGTKVAIEFKRNSEGILHDKEEHAAIFIDGFYEALKFLKNHPELLNSLAPF